MKTRPMENWIEEKLEQDIYGILWREFDKKQNETRELFEKKVDNVAKHYAREIAKEIKEEIKKAKNNSP